MKGDWEGLVSEELFAQTQRVLAGKAVEATAPHAEGRRPLPSQAVRALRILRQASNRICVQGMRRPICLLHEEKPRPREGRETGG